MQDVERPSALETVSKYVVDCDGRTEMPLWRGTGPTPDRTALEAFCENHARLADSPAEIVVGLTEMTHESGPDGCCAETRV